MVIGIPEVVLGLLIFWLGLGFGITIIKLMERDDD